MYCTPFRNEKLKTARDSFVSIPLPNDWDLC